LNSRVSEFCSWQTIAIGNRPMPAIEIYLVPIILVVSLLAEDFHFSYAFEMHRLT
jgi:hypothetical protein